MTKNMQICGHVVYMSVQTPEGLQRLLVSDLDTLEEAETLKANINQRGPKNQVSVGYVMQDTSKLIHGVFVDENEKVLVKPRFDDENPFDYFDMILIETTPHSATLQ